ncbi:MAG: hypothetical protein MAG715_01147 [Methanonatronarchaeales archaeon]|nr:hypothetical protein [Methanonatronarchaeales archaeon]
MSKPPAALHKMDFDRDLFLVIWEVTQACDLVCEHCRAEAQPERHAGELSTEEGKELLHQGGHRVLHR